MVGVEVILFAFVVLVLLGAWEAWVHEKNLAKIPIRIHVNGTRGKSSVVRLIAGALREAGITTCAKTTGTLARFILPDAAEYPVFRPAGANVIEQVRVVSVAAAHGARALVVECMALQPILQWLCESRFIRATCGVITNAREDHLDIMGPEEEDVAWALAGTTPVRSKLFTASNRYVSVFAQSAQDRGTRLIRVFPEDVAAVSDEEIAAFPHVEHKVNVALALKVCLDLGIARETALRGMWQAEPDPGALTASHIRFFGRDIYFVNAFAANDPESTKEQWEFALRRYPKVEKKIIIFNCRADRPLRSHQLGEVCAGWPPADYYILMGTGTYFLVRAAAARGLATNKFILAENKSDSAIFETIIELAGNSAVVVGMGNTKGQGLSLSRFFHNRSILKGNMQKEVQVP